MFIGQLHRRDSQPIDFNAVLAEFLDAISFETFERFYSASRRRGRKRGKFQERLLIVVRARRRCSVEHGGLDRKADILRGRGIDEKKKIRVIFQNDSNSFFFFKTKTSMAIS